MADKPAVRLPARTEQRVFAVLPWLLLLLICASAVWALPSGLLYRSQLQDSIEQARTQRDELQRQVGRQRSELDHIKNDDQVLEGQLRSALGLIRRGEALYIDEPEQDNEAEDRQ